MTTAQRGRRRLPPDEDYVRTGHFPETPLYELDPEDTLQAGTDRKLTLIEAAVHLDKLEETAGQLADAGKVLFDNSVVLKAITGNLMLNIGILRNKLKRLD